VLPDYLRNGLDVVFVGTSVATASATAGHYYRGAGNKFWEFLWEAGLTGERLLVPEQDALVLDPGLGLTDLVKGRAASSDTLLTTSDYDIPGFIEKIQAFSPFVVAFNGKEAARRVSRQQGYGEPTLGLADWKLGNTWVYVLPSSSGSSADPRHYEPKESKVAWWQDFGKWLRASNHGYTSRSSSSSS
jgi:double-stranded uracil-DNA glycosylase